LNKENTIVSTPTQAGTLRLIATGGTFDKRYDPATGLLGFGRESALPALLAQARIEPTPMIETLMLIDSLDMTDADREQIASACRRSAERAIVVIHGTDTMIETARVLAAAALDATIVLTGAMVPASIERSDAVFNLGFAIACAQTLHRGVHIAAHGRVFDWNRVRKNREAARFEPI
jgi:L-asparaginase